MKIADKLRKIREQRGYSQECMAYTIGVSYGTYHSIEKGKTDIRFSTLEKCAQALDISLLDLLPDYHVNFCKSMDETVGYKK